MRLRNNCKTEKEWNIGPYNCGEEEVLIPVDGEFVCSDAAGRIILKNLGADAWVVEIPEAAPVEELKVVEEPKTEVVTEEPEEVVDEKVFCEDCDAKGPVRHRLICGRKRR